MKSKLILAPPLAALLLVGAGCGSTATPSASVNAAVGSNQGPGAGNDNAAAPTGTAAGTGTHMNGTTVIGSPRSATISLRSKSSADEYGTATLTDLGNNKTHIVITLKNAQRDQVEPAAIYGGSCADAAKEIQYALNPSVKGKSDTTLNVSIGALIDKAAQSIRIKSDAVAATEPYAACGELK